MEISATQLKNRIQSGENVHILDVREEWEYLEGHIEGARHFSLYDIPTAHEQLADWKHHEVIVHCKSGTRGRTAQVLLQQHGFAQVLNLTGGYEAFKKA